MAEIPPENVAEMVAENVAEKVAELPGGEVAEMATAIEPFVAAGGVAERVAEVAVPSENVAKRTAEMTTLYLDTGAIISIPGKDEGIQQSGNTVIGTTSSTGGAVETNPGPESAQLAQVAQVEEALAKLNDAEVSSDNSCRSMFVFKLSYFSVFIIRLALSPLPPLPPASSKFMIYSVILHDLKVPPPPSHVKA